MTSSHLFLLFLIYSGIGWISEVLYCSFIEHKFVNRGFLFGPLCPVYGFGGLLVIYLLQPFAENVFVLFTMAMLLTSAVEYLTGWILESVFHTKWWDYSQYRFNVHGRVCALNSTLFGLMGVLAVRFVHPAIETALARIPGESMDVLAAGFAVILGIDLVVTLRALVNIGERRAAFESLVESLRDRLDVREWFNEHDVRESLSRLKSLVARDHSPYLEALQGRFEGLFARSAGMRRLFGAFPALGAWHETMAGIPAEGAAAAHCAEGAASAHGAEGAEGGVGATRSGTARALKGESPAFASGFGFYKYFWVFLAASFIGVVLESIWCAATLGRVESRSGLVYGMLNPVYGLGGVLITVLFARRENRKDLGIFFGGMLVGGGFEYLCSLAQELAFGAVSWEYSGTLLNLHGRTNLMFSLIWGALVLLWVREIYPALSRLIERIPILAGKILTFAALALILANAAVSGVAVHRWSERDRGVPAANGIERLADERFPDERLRAIYPNMRFVSRSY